MIKFQKILKEIKIEKVYSLTDRGIELMNDINVLYDLKKKYPHMVTSIDDTDEGQDEWFLRMMGFDEFKKQGINQKKNNTIQNTDEDMWEDNHSMVDELVKKGYLK